MSLGGKLATDVISKYAKKGNNCIAVGEIQSNKGTGDNEKITYWNLSVDEFYLTGSKIESENNSYSKPIIDDTLPF